MFGKTILQSALNRVGVVDHDNQLELAIARFLNVTSNDVDRLRQIVDRSIGKLELAGEGLGVDATTGRRSNAFPRQPLEDEGGPRACAGNGQGPTAPSSSSSRDVVGLISAASNGHCEIARPAREPTLEQRAAALRVMKASAAAAQTVFDRMKTSGGFPWGDVGEHELAGMGRDGRMATAINNWLGPRSERQRFKPLRELMTPQHFETVVEQVRGQNDAN